MPSPRKRIEESTRARTHDNIAQREEAKVWGQGQVTIPQPGDWHPQTVAWYQSLAESGQSQFYENSDWQSAWFCASLMDKVISNPNPSPSLLDQIIKLQRDLMTTEGSRRKAGVELMRPPADVDTTKVTAVEYYRNRLKAG